MKHKEVRRLLASVFKNSSLDYIKNTINIDSDAESRDELTKDIIKRIKKMSNNKR